MNTKLLSHKTLSLNQIFSLSIKIFLLLLFLFARTFTGINIFGFRLGEYLIGGSLVLLILHVLLIPLFKRKYILDDKNLNIVISILILSFFVFLFINNNDFLNEFIYKTSSYIWSIGAVSIGYIYLSYFKFKIYRFDIVLTLLSLFVIYLFSTRGISENNQNILLNFTDKFEYPKGSDLLLVFIFVFYIYAVKSDYSKASFINLCFMTSIYVPLFLVKSRSGFISLIIFLLILLPKYVKYFKKFDKYILLTILISIILLLISTSWVVSRDISIDEEIEEELKYVITSRYQTINDNVYEREVLKLKLFYFRDGRIFSSDGNLNWRFQIWQDIFRDMGYSRLFIMGYGFDDIIPAMDSDQRYGQDKQNINVHNYFVHIFSRGGAIHLSLMLMMYYYIYKKFYINNMTKDYFLITLPLIFNSLFDPSMENAHYPIIFYILLGMALNKSIMTKWEKQ